MVTLCPSVKWFGAKENPALLEATQGDRAKDPSPSLTSPPSPSVEQ